MTQIEQPRAVSIDMISEAITSTPARSELHEERAGGWARWSLLAGGVVFAVGNALHPLEHNEAALDRPTWQAAHLLIFASIPLLVLGLPYLGRRLTGRVPSRLAAVAVTASIVGLIGIGPGCILEAFVAPVIGQAAMKDLESGGMGVVNAILGVAYLGGTITLGWAVARAKLRPRWAGPSLVAGAVVLLGIMGATGPAAGAVIIAATVAYGLALSALALRA
ncbi:MAG TPA: hypothetical protein VNS19_10465 [Acidimicrobiales bacterium]|nr:hypothetical protein [Acidimicrobiales bacterium]